MPQSVEHGRWRAIGKSVRGNSHLRTGLPNQDALQITQAKGSGTPIIVAVSDGHGGSRYFRSHHGARLAVEAATGRLALFLGEASGDMDMDLLGEVAHRLPRYLTAWWRQSVLAHLRDHPISVAELDALEAKDGVTSRASVEQDPVLAYGATLLIAVVTDAFVMYFQLGDGDILEVDAAGSVVRPLPPDARLFANETTSLCAPSAWRDARLQLQPLKDRATPELVLLATDGYANSFRNDTGFRQVGSDFLNLVRTHGFAAVAEQLEGWLEEASERGSGDDITLGLICQLSNVPLDHDIDSAGHDTPCKETTGTGPAISEIP